MELLRVFNNNFVLAQDEAGREVILTGRGLGFQARPGQEIDPARIVRVFVPSDGRDPDHLAQLLSGIPPEHILLVGLALADVGLDKLSRNPALVIALADHVSFALRRIAKGMDLEYPLLAEVQNLYAEEYAEAKALLGAINSRSKLQLPAAEAVGLALHLVNAGFATGDLSYTYTMTGVIQQMVAVIEQTYSLDLDLAASASGGSSRTCATCSSGSTSTSSSTRSTRRSASPSARRIPVRSSARSALQRSSNCAWDRTSPRTRSPISPCTSPESQPTRLTRKALRREPPG